MSCFLLVEFLVFIVICDFVTLFYFHNVIAFAGFLTISKKCIAVSLIQSKWKVEHL